VPLRRPISASATSSGEDGRRDQAERHPVPAVEQPAVDQQRRQPAGGHHQGKEQHHPHRGPGDRPHVRRSPADQPLAELVLPRRTVQMHVSHILRKFA
jgi:hypothetical protein